MLNFFVPLVTATFFVASLAGAAMAQSSSPRAPSDSMDRSSMPSNSGTNHGTVRNGRFKTHGAISSSGSGGHDTVYDNSAGIYDESSSGM